MRTPARAASPAGCDTAEPVALIVSSRQASVLHDGWPPAPWKPPLSLGLVAFGAPDIGQQAFAATDQVPLKRFLGLRYRSRFQSVQDVAMLGEDTTGVAREIDIGRMGLRQDALMPGGDHGIVPGKDKLVVELAIERQRGRQILQGVALQMKRVLFEVPGKLVQQPRRDRLTRERSPNRIELDQDSRLVELLHIPQGEKADDRSPSNL